LSVLRGLLPARSSTKNREPVLTPAMTPSSVRCFQSCRQPCRGRISCQRVPANGFNGKPRSKIAVGSEVSRRMTGMSGRKASLSEDSPDVGTAPVAGRSQARPTAVRPLSSAARSQRSTSLSEPTMATAAREVESQIPQTSGPLREAKQRLKRLRVSQHHAMIGADRGQQASVRAQGQANHASLGGASRGQALGGLRGVNPCNWYSTWAAQ
jgi:hypothetical protein